MSNVIEFPDTAEYFNFWALCLACGHKWIAGVTIEVPLMELECPQCSEQNSFPSRIPEDYSQKMDRHYTPRKPCKVISLRKEENGNRNSQEALAET